MNQELEFIKTNEDIIYFSDHIRQLMDHSDKITQSAIESICYLETSINQNHLKVEEIFEFIKKKRDKMDNINKVVNDLDNLNKIIDIIHNDKLKISEGPQGSFHDYIEKLNYLKSIDKYSSIKEFGIQYGQNNRSTTYLLNYTFEKYNEIMNQGEKLLVQEFQDVIKHYSNPQQITSYIDHIINKFQYEEEKDDEDADEKENDDEEEEEDDEGEGEEDGEENEDDDEENNKNESESLLEYNNENQNNKNDDTFVQIVESDDDNNINEDENKDIMKLRHSKLIKNNLKKSNQSSFRLKSTKTCLFIPKETLAKLEQICWWFLKREQQYELYNEKNEHCDINQKLKYCEIRSEFLKFSIKQYSKMSSIDFMKDSKDSSVLKQGLGKLFNPSMHSNLGSSSSSSSSIDHHHHHHHHLLHSSSGMRASNFNTTSLAHTLSNKFNFIHTSFHAKSNEIKLRNNDSLILLSASQSDPKLISANKRLSDNETLSNQNDLNSPDDTPSNSSSSSTSKPTSIDTKSSKPVECIQTFANNLDFCLKLLKHENTLLSSIYYKSDETRIELASKLTILVIDIIQDEFERFFTNACDFSKLSNNGQEVVSAMVHLIVKVQNLKEKATCLQTEDLSSAAKLLKFSMRLNEISAQIFSNYLEVVKNGLYNFYRVPMNCTIHEYCVKTCNIWRMIHQNQNHILDSLKIACDNQISQISSSRNSESSEKGNDLPNTPDLRLNRLRIRRGRNQAKNNNNNNGDDFEYSPKWYFTKYYLFLIEKLTNFLNEEATKSDSISNEFTLIPTSFITSSKFNILKANLKCLKSHIFIINNIEYIKDVIHELNLIKKIRKINANFEDSIEKSIETNIEKSCEIFRFLARKWMKLNSLNDKSPSIDLDYQYELNNSISLSNNRQHGLSSFKSSTQSLHNSSKLRGLFRLNGKTSHQNNNSFENGNENGFTDETSDTHSKKSSDKSSGSSGSSTYKMFKSPFTDSKKKKKDDFIIMLKETLNVCMRVVIEKPKLNEILKRIASDNLTPILEEFESTGDLKEILDYLNIFVISKNDSAIEKIFNQLFPNSNL